jgi:phosphotransferase system enzyme I (PtsP)
VTFFVTIAPHRARAIHEAEAVDEVNKMLSGEVHEGAFIQGIPAASGVAIGTVALLGPLAELDSIPDREVQDVVAEEATLRTAVADVQRELGEAVQRFAPRLSKDVRELFDVYIMLLGDDVLVSQTVGAYGRATGPRGMGPCHYRTRTRLRTDGRSLPARADDIREIGQRIRVRLQADVREPLGVPGTLF